MSYSRILGDQNEEQLKEIKNYIVRRISTDYSDKGFHKFVDNFLQRLVKDTEEETLYSHECDVKIAAQLLCSIAIDLKNDVVPASHYSMIFSGIDMKDFEDHEKQARMLFTDSVSTNNLQYKAAERMESDAYSLIVFPIKDLKYFISDKEMRGVPEPGEVYSPFVQRLRMKRLKLAKGIFHKKSERNKFPFFWICPRAEIVELIKEKNNPVADVVDKLGLSHFDFSKDETKYYFYIDLEGVRFETFKPNATIINWGDPRNGYISYKRDEAGRTFSISGYDNFNSGIKERAFEYLMLEDEGIEKAKIQVIQNYIDQPIEIAASAFIQEAIQRFNMEL